MAGNWHRIGNISGRDGVGVPQGGAQGEALVKEGGTDYATSWRQLSYEEIAGKVPASALPQISNEPYVVASQSAMLNLPAVPGRMAIRTDEGKTFVLSQLPASTLENWVELTTTSDVQSVNSKTGNVVLTKGDVGLDKVNNTADADKPQATTSTPGLMPASDKKDLNEATDKGTPGTLVERDSGGAAEFSSVHVKNAPTKGTELTSKDFVDTIVSDALKIVELSGAVSAHTDLNEHKAVGRYSLSSDSAGGTPDNWEALNYPFRFGWGNVINQSWSSTGTSFSQIVIGHTSSTWQPKVAVRTYAAGTEQFSPWTVLASDDLATSTVKGLMSPAHKALLDTATRSNTSDSLVRRGSGSTPTQLGRAETDSITYIGPNASGPQAVANKQYVDWEIGRLVASGTIGFDESWDTLGSLSRAGIVEGFPLGCPAGRDVSIFAADDPSDGFVKDPVWRFHHEVMGLGYHRQTAELLSCDPTYMIGFTWERTYRPGDAQWTRWNCIAGDTGDIEAMASSGDGVRDREWVYAYQVGRLYTEGILPYTRRSGDTVYLVGAGKPRDEADLPDIASNDGTQLGYFRYQDEWPIRRIWVSDSHVTAGKNPQGVGVQQGSSRNRWFLNTVDNENQQLSIRASRYGPTPSADMSTNTWLPYSTSWLAPQVMTWQGSGWLGG